MVQEDGGRSHNQSCTWVWGGNCLTVREGGVYACASFLAAAGVTYGVSSGAKRLQRLDGISDGSSSSLRRENNRKPQ